jgi:hypothetical protein
LPIKLKLGNNFPEPIAQGSGNLCYYIDARGKFWEKLGNEVRLKNKTAATANPTSPFVQRKATERETFMEELYLEGIRLGEVRIPMRPIMRAEGVTKPSQITKGDYRLKIFASSNGGGVCELLVNGVKREFAVKGDALLALDVNLPENAELAADCKLKSGDVILHGLSLEPVNP